MTNQEAKEKLYMEWQKFLEDNIDYAGISDAYQKAFKALEQEPMVEIDLDYVIKQKYIEREVLDKIKGYIDYIRNTGMGKKKSLEFIEKFIDGLKAESEE